MVAKKTSYIDSNISETDDMVDDMTPRKMRTRTYVLRLSLKTPFFKNLSNNNAELVLPKFKFAGSNQLPLVKSHILERHSFKPVRLFALNVELTAVPEKTNGNKLISIKKNFYKIDGFREASTPSKFLRIIRVSFTSEFSINKAKELVICEKIIVNNDLKKVNSHTDKKIVVKKIPVDLSKLAVESQKALIEFESFKIADLVTAKWSVFMGKDFIYVVKAINNKQSWVSKDLHQTLLYTFLVGTMAHNLSDLLELYGEKLVSLAIISSSYMHNRCAIVCFVDEISKLAAIGSTPVFKGVNLCWAGFSLACCAQCKWLSHISTECLLNKNSGVHDKQVVASGFSSHVVSLGFLGVSSSLGAKPVSMVSNSLVNSCLVSVIMKKLSFMKVVPLASKLYILSLVALGPVTFSLNSDMALNDTIAYLFFSFSVVADPVADFSLSSSKILTIKMGRLESKIVALEVLVESVLERLDHLCSGLGSSTFLTFQ
ncbi:hypothetical protein G9A89_009986 [Geosiphon pyriformis]|nr:hypothetical protein G9A89_009986 [Geosiphon pyriformis]